MHGALGKRGGMATGYRESPGKGIEFLMGEIFREPGVEMRGSRQKKIAIEAAGDSIAAFVQSGHRVQPDRTRIPPDFRQRRVHLGSKQSRQMEIGQSNG